MQLGIDTSTTWSSIALTDGAELVAQSEADDRNPGEFVVGAIDELLATSGVSRTQLDRVIVGVGPGPYTSTRVGVAIARTLGFALNIEVAGVCSHDAIAAQFVASESRTAGDDFVVATDARRREIYWARYDSSGRRVLGPNVSKPAEVATEFAQCIFAGNGFDRYPDLVSEFQLDVVTPNHPAAQWITRIALQEFESGRVVPQSQPDLADHGDSSARPFDPAQCLFAAFPLYLRRPDAVPSAKAVVS